MRTEIPGFLWVFPGICLLEAFVGRSSSFLSSTTVIAASNWSQEGVSLVWLAEGREGRRGGGHGKKRGEEEESRLNDLARISPTFLQEY